MFNLNKLDQKMMSSVQEHIQLGTKEILNNWKILPKYTCNAHIPLLQASQLVSFLVCKIAFIIIMFQLFYYCT